MTTPLPARGLQGDDAPPKDAPSDSESSTSDPLDLADDEGWEDVAPEEEDKQPIVSLFSQEVFPDVRSMLTDCKEKFGFDFVAVQREFDLDFLGKIKLVNYIRSQVKAGNSKPDVSSASLFEDELYMMPVLEDDALLYSLDDISGEEQLSDSGEGQSSRSKERGADKRVSELQEELDRLQGQFADYHSAVKRSLDKDMEKKDQWLSSKSDEPPAGGSNKVHQEESNYFTSYSYNTIHESMLKDSVRTDSYRDFIYDNKRLFKDKVVLDVGCGTGILSMFCAKAGAKQVIAVDNSNIIERAREIVYDNGFGDVIKCLRGKIEEVVLPVQKVDIIVSEWMGYCLLFEAMFDSVMWARDRYLAPGGLMVPSHATLRIAPISDPDFISSHISFWKSVYGFDMSKMLMNIHDEVVVRSIPQSTVAAEPTAFLHLPLHTVTQDELIFIKDFNVTLAGDIDALDGWAVWFDMFFMPSAESTVPADAIPDDMVKKGYVAFTTGPEGPETHWQTGVLLIDHGDKRPAPLKKGQVIKGKVGYKKKEEGSRLLDIEVVWDGGDADKGRQSWSLE